ncbi:hypothetical protein PFISCL1PPCAC_4902, partial [Pristionchus fissidentatus]
VIGGYTMSFLQNGKVYHIRINTKMIEDKKTYYFLEDFETGTLFELISHYIQMGLNTPHFKVFLRQSCPLPEQH